MKASHFHVNGKCLCCGFRDKGSSAPPPNPGPLVEDLYDDCPLARYYFLRVFLVMLPILLLSIGWEVALIATLLGGVFFSIGLTAEDEKWYGLRNVREEYNGLLQSVPSRKKSFYIRHLEAALLPLFTQRDKAFNARAVLGNESLDEIEFKIEQIRKKSQCLDDPALIEMYRNQLRDLNENRKKFEQIQGFLAKFETSRNCVAESIRLLRNRVLITAASGDEAEELKILEDLKSLHEVYEKVNKVKVSDPFVNQPMFSEEETPEETLPPPPERIPEK